MRADKARDGYGSAAGLHTQAGHAARAGAADARSLTPPIYQSCAFTFDDLDRVDGVFDGRVHGYSYSRMANPNCDQLATAVARLEGAESAMAAASGMAAIHAALRACLSPDRRRIVCADDIYGGTFTLFDEVMRADGIDIAYVRSDRLDEIAGAIDGATAALYFETISNPTLRVADLPAIAAIAQEHKIPLIVDNTFASPHLCRPLEHGATVVVHSVTKYLGGHHDATAGVAVGPEDLIARADRYNILVGGTLDPFAAWLALRGVRTLGLRLDKASANAAALARLLSERREVKRVYYPGHPSHPDCAVAACLLPKGSGGMLSFDLLTLAAADRFVRGLSLIRFAPTLGGFDTTISHPVLTSHRGVPADRLAAKDISPGLIRMSVGCEDYDDLAGDLLAALAALA